MGDQSGRESTSDPERSDWEPYLRAWRERLSREERNRMVAAHIAREAAQRAASVLTERFGCTRVYLFGSLTGRSSGRFGLQSDVDLAVEGLPIERYMDALAVLEGVFHPGTGFDLVRLEDTLPSLVAHVQSTGEVLADEAAIRCARRRSE